MDDAPPVSGIRAERLLRRLIWACFPEAIHRGLVVRFAQEFVPQAGDGEILRACAVRLDAPADAEPLRLGLDLGRGEPRILLGGGIAIVACVTDPDGIARAAIYVGEGDVERVVGDVDLGEHSASDSGRHSGQDSIGRSGGKESGPRKERGPLGGRAERRGTRVK